MIRMDDWHINEFYQHLIVHFLIKFNNTFAFPDPEPPIIKILINDGQEYKANSDYDLIR